MTLRCLVELYLLISPYHDLTCRVCAVILRSSAALLAVVLMTNAGTVGLRAGVVSALRTRPTQRGSWLRSAGKFRTNVTAWAWGRSGCHDTLRIHRLESRRGRSKALSVVVIFHQPRHGLPRINNCQSMVWNVSPSLCKIRAPLVLLLQAFRLSLQR